MTADMDLVSLVEQFNSDEACRTALEQLRWPDGVACIRCGSLTVYRRTNRKLFECKDCGHQFSVTTGTIFHDTHLPLYKWFLATYLMVEAKKGISANQLKRTIKVSYKTAWYLSHRIRQAVADVERKELEGIIEADETFVGGKPRYAAPMTEYGHRRMGPRTGDDRKAIVLGALQRGGEVRMRVSKTRSGKAIQAFIDDAAGEIAVLHTDELPTYVGVARNLGVPHESVNHSEKEYVRGDVTTNGMESVWSLLKRSIIGSYHQLSEKHLDAYLAELEWRFNNRENPHLFRDTLRALVTADPLRYSELTAE